MTLKDIWEMKEPDGLVNKDIFLLGKHITDYFDGEPIKLLNHMHYSFMKDFIWVGDSASILPQKKNGLRVFPAEYAGLVVLKYLNELLEGDIMEPLNHFLARVAGGELEYQFNCENAVEIEERVRLVLTVAHQPIEEIPLYVGHELGLVQTVARWRLEIGK